MKKCSRASSRVASAEFEGQSRVERDKECRGIAVRLGETKIAAEGPRRTDADIGDGRLPESPVPAVLVHEQRALDLAMGRHRADGQLSPAAVVRDLPQSRDSFDVDQVREVRQSLFHDDQQLGSAGVDRGVTIELRHQ